MKWRILKGIVVVSALAATTNAPLIPSQEIPRVWYEPYIGATICYQRYTTGPDVPFPCSEYWKIAQTPDQPPPHRLRFHSLLNPQKAEAAIAFDNTSNTGDLGLSASYSWSHTVNSSTNGVLVVGAGTRDSTLDCVPTGITYNTVSLTSIRSDATSGGQQTSIWSLVNPASGAHTVAVTINSNCSIAGAGAISLTGVDQTTPNDAKNGAKDAVGAQNATVSITTVKNNAWVVSFMATARIGTSDMLPGNSMIERFEIDHASDNFTGGTVGPVINAGATTTNWTWTTTNEVWAISSASFCPNPCSAADSIFDLLRFE